MKVEVLVAALNQDPEELISRMKLETPAVIVNQCDKDGLEVISNKGEEIRVLSMTGRGVGRSRNAALMMAREEICLFSDEDIVFESDYGRFIVQEFEAHPEADMILFNVSVREERKTYFNIEWKRIHWYNCGRYGAVSFAIRRDKLWESRVAFSLLFGGGAKYCAGEDSLFLNELLRKGYKVYASPLVIGREESEVSSWFFGHDEKFFYDRGVLYRYLYKWLAPAMALRFLIAHRKKLCEELTLHKAWESMWRGILKK